MSGLAMNTIYLIAAIVVMLPGAYFAWMVIKGLILTLRQSKDDDL